MKGIISGVIVLAAVILANSSIFTVKEGTQALILRFGKISSDPITQAGLYFKMPFIDEVRVFEKRILIWDGDDKQIPTKDKKFIIVDTTARWRIVDAIKFAKNAVTIYGAQSKLNGILDGITRDTISNNNLVEAVRNTNNILNEPITAESDVVQAEIEEVLGDIEKVQIGREKLSQLIVKEARKNLGIYGIELIDVQLRSIAYETTVEQKVYERMISERKRIAEKIRSKGKGEAAKIEGRVNKDLRRIESEAHRKGLEIKGAAEAEAAEIYAKAMQANPDFYSFYRTLQTYDKIMTNENSAEFTLSLSSDFLKLLKKGPK